MEDHEKILTPDERSELIAILQNFSNLRTGQDQVLWSIFGSFWGTNGLLLISFFSAESKWTVSQVGIIVSLVGFIISIFWIIIQSKAINRIEMYEDSIQHIEQKLFSKKIMFAFPKKIKSCIKIKARDIMRFSSIIVCISWLISFIYFFVIMICKCRL